MRVSSSADLVDSLAKQGAPPSQLHRVEALRQLCEMFQRCVACCLVGSLAKGTGDRISDLDLVVFTAPGAAQAFLAEAGRALGGDAVLDDYGSVRADGSCFRKYVYLDFTSAEIHVTPTTSQFRLYRPYRALYDPTGLLPTLTVEGSPPRHEDLEPYPHGDAGLIWELVDLIKWIKRGRTDLAKTYLRKLADRLQIDRKDRA